MRKKDRIKNSLSIGSSLFLFFASTTFVAFGDSIISFSLSTTGKSSFTLVFSFVDSTVTKADLEENIAGADVPASFAACEGGEKKSPPSGLKALPLSSLSSEGAEGRKRDLPPWSSSNFPIKISI